MKAITGNIFLLFCALIALTIQSCSDDKGGDLLLDGDARIESIKVNGVEGVINQSTKTIGVNLPTSVDLTDLRIESITLSPGASCDYPAGTVFNGTVPRAIKVINGDLFETYTLNVKHDNVEFISFTLNGKYSGTINNILRTIQVVVPMEEDVRAMQVAFEVNEGTTVTPEAGSLVDFSNPVTFTATQRSAVVDYVVTVIQNDMSQAPKAFVGNTYAIEGLSPEAKAACRWMLDNVPNTRYISIQDIIDGREKLEDYKMIWCHFDWTDWPGEMWDSRDLFNNYWLKGGSILASRDGARYINDVWRIAKDQQCPNNMFGGDEYNTLDNPLGFTVTGHADHPLYSNLEMDGDRVDLLSAGCTCSNRTLQWFVDWDPYKGMEGWESRTGAKALASGHNYDPNQVTIAEFEPYEALKGFTSGRVITIGTPAYEWYQKNGAANAKESNMIQLTKNAINYLCR